MRCGKHKGLAVLVCAAVITGNGIAAGAYEEAEQADVPVTGADEQAEFSFADLSKVDFWFSSGAGAWGTTLKIYEDGSFEGEYHDSDMGVTGEGYPGGTMYLADFTGKFTEPEKVNDYTYSFQMESINLAQEIGTEEIKDNVRYIYSEAYGLDDGEDFLIYLPGAPLEELPQTFLSWVGYYDLSSTDETELPFYGFYNELAGNGFSGYEAVEEESADEELAAIEAEAEEIESRLQSGSLTQWELNELAASLYQLWDDKLNAVWGELKATLDEASMNQLVEEELAWIDYKENEIQAAGAEYEGGSIQPMIQYIKGAELTRERTYELVKLLQ